MKNPTVKGIIVKHIPCVVCETLIRDIVIYSAQVGFKHFIQTDTGKKWAVSICTVAPTDSRGIVCLTLQERMCKIGIRFYTLLTIQCSI